MDSRTDLAAFKLLSRDLAAAHSIIGDCVRMDASAWFRVLTGALAGSDAYRMLLCTVRTDLALRADVLIESADSAGRQSETSTPSSASPTVTDYCDVCQSNPQPLEFVWSGPDVVLSAGECHAPTMRPASAVGESL